MTCREFTDVIGRFLDGDLEPRTLAAFRQHLAGCPDCVQYLRNHKDTIRLARAAFASPDAQTPPEVPEELIRAILESRSRQ